MVAEDDLLPAADEALDLSREMRRRKCAGRGGNRRNTPIRHRSLKRHSRAAGPWRVSSVRPHIDVAHERKSDIVWRLRHERRTPMTGTSAEPPTAERQIAASGFRDRTQTEACSASRAGGPSRRAGAAVGIPLHRVHAGGPRPLRADLHGADRWPTGDGGDDRPRRDPPSVQRRPSGPAARQRPIAATLRGRSAGDAGAGGAPRTPPHAAATLPRRKRASVRGADREPVAARAGALAD